MAGQSSRVSGISAELMLADLTGFLGQEYWDFCTEKVENLGIGIGIVIKEISREFISNREKCDCNLNKP